ncbi:MAG: fatty acid desaturase [Cyanobacteria bacterium J06635_15]
MNLEFQTKKGGTSFVISQKDLMISLRDLKVLNNLNPTFFLFWASIFLLILSTYGFWHWQWFQGGCFCINLLSLYFLGTNLHEAAHQTAHPNRWVNDTLGYISAFLLCFSFSVFKRVHIQHHAHVNDPLYDPDYFVSKGGPPWLMPIRFAATEVFFFKHHLWRGNDLIEWLFNRLAIVGIVGLACYFKLLGLLMGLWFLPAFFVGLILGIIAYLSHHPFGERDRWKNTRAYPNTGLNWILLGQNYHLIHHLWVSIPWYRYQTAYRISQPLLVSKGCQVPQRSVCT